MIKNLKNCRSKNRLNAEYIDSDLKPNENSSYRIIAVSFNGIKSGSSQVVSSTSKALPPQVEHLSASTDGSSKIILTWDAPTYEDFSYYKVYSTSSSFLPLVFWQRLIVLLMRI